MNRLVSLTVAKTEVSAYMLKQVEVAIIPIENRGNFIFNISREFKLSLLFSYNKLQR